MDHIRPDQIYKISGRFVSKAEKNIKYSLEYTSLKQRLSDFNLILRKSIREANISYYNATFQKYKNDIKNM